MKTHQDRANNLILKANAAKENGMLDDAIRSYREAMKLVPAYSTFNVVIGDMLQAENRHRDAADAYLRTVLDTPDHDQAWVGLGQCRLLLDEHEEAIEAFRSALAANPSNPDAHYYLALLLSIIDDIKGAETHLLSALKQRPAWEDQARQEASLKPVFENSRRLANLNREKKWWEVWK